MIIFATWPSWAIASGRLILRVFSFTDENFLPLWNSVNERSRIHLNGFDLCGIIATGNIFSFLGISFLMSPHFTSIAYLCFTLSSVSWRSWRTAFFLLAYRWGPLSSINAIFSRDQSSPQSTGHSSCTYPCRRFIASWCTVYGNCGHIRPSKYLPIVASTDIYVGILSLFCNFS